MSTEVSLQAVPVGDYAVVSNVVVRRVSGDSWQIDGNVYDLHNAAAAVERMINLMRLIPFNAVCGICGCTGTAPRPAATRDAADQLTLDGATVLASDGWRGLLCIQAGQLGAVILCRYCLFDPDATPLRMGPLAHLRGTLLGGEE